jgi:hypothetical protein
MARDDDELTLDETHEKSRRATLSNASSARHPSTGIDYRREAKAIADDLVALLVADCESHNVESCSRPLSRFGPDWPRHVN